MEQNVTGILTRVNIDLQINGRKCLNVIINRANVIATHVEMMDIEIIGTQVNQRITQCIAHVGSSSKT